MEAVKNALRHPLRLLVLVLSLVIGVVASFLILTILRTAELLGQPTIPPGVLRISFALEAPSSLTPAQFLEENGLQGEWVTLGQLFREDVRRGAAIGAYGFESVETMKRFLPTLRLKQGGWPKQYQLLVPQQACRLLSCRVGQTIKVLYPGTEQPVRYTVSGIVDSPLATTLLAVPAAPRGGLDWRLWAFARSQSSEELEDQVRAYLQSRGLKAADVQVLDRIGKQRSWRQLSFGFTVILGPTALVALISATLLVLFNFAVNRLERAKEVAIKRALGASRSHIALESLAEAMAIFLLAVPPSLAVTWALLDRLGGGEAQRLFYPEVGIALQVFAGIGALVLLSALGPVLALASTQPSSQLKEE